MAGQAAPPAEAHCTGSSAGLDRSSSKVHSITVIAVGVPLLNGMQVHGLSTGTGGGGGTGGGKVGVGGVTACAGGGAVGVPLAEDTSSHTCSRMVVRVRVEAHSISDRRREATDVGEQGCRTSDIS